MALDVRVQHPQYKAFYASIMAARDCFDGERAVKARGNMYLPQLSGQRFEDYQAYKSRATFYAIVGRTVMALTGLATHGTPTVEASPEARKMMAEAPHGLQFEELKYKCILETQLMGRFGILIDSPAVSQTVGLYPYLSDDIINWRTDSAGKPLFVVLKEGVETIDDDNPYKVEITQQYRVLEVDNGVYTQCLYDDDSKLISKVVPSFEGKMLDYIPFFIMTPFGLGFEVEKSPMEDIVSVNLSHYRTSADLEHGRHFCGLPTPIVSGADIGTAKFRIGGSQAWVLPGVDAKAYYLEFTGQGLLSLEKALQEKEAQLSSLSVNVLDRASRGSESADTVRLRYTSETASLAMVVSAAEALMGLAYSTAMAMSGQSEIVKFIFAKQFIGGALSATEVQKYSEVYLTGGMSVESYVDVLRRGGALPANRGDQEEMSSLTAMADKKAQQLLASKPVQLTQPNQGNPNASQK